MKTLTVTPEDDILELAIDLLKAILPCEQNTQIKQ